METCRTCLFESIRTPGWVLMTKTVVDSDKNAAFWVKGVNLSDESVMPFMFKNQKVGIINFKIVDYSGPLSLSPGKDGPSVFYITNYLSKRYLEELHRFV